MSNTIYVLPRSIGIIACAARLCMEQAAVSVICGCTDSLLAVRAIFPSLNLRRELEELIVRVLAVI